MKKIFCRVLLPLIMLSVSACSPITTEENKEANPSGRETVTSNEITVTKLDMSDRFDTICGVVRTRDDALIVAGMKNNQPYLSYVSDDGLGMSVLCRECD